MDEMTEGEKNFALKVEEFLSSVPKPEYRQLLVEVCPRVFFEILVAAPLTLHIPRVTSSMWSWNISHVD